MFQSLLFRWRCWRERWKLALERQDRWREGEGRDGEQRAPRRTRRKYGEESRYRADPEPEPLPVPALEPPPAPPPPPAAAPAITKLEMLARAARSRRGP